MRRRQRITYLLIAAPVLVLAVGLVLYALQDTIVYFYSPTELAEKDVPSGLRIRIGGLVEEESVQRLQGARVSFVVTDLNEAIKVEYEGLLPDLFREGQGVVAVGELASPSLFVADQVLAKHDENYMPPEVAEALKASGKWREGSDSK